MSVNPKTSKVQGSTYFAKLLKSDPCVFCGRAVPRKAPAWMNQDRRKLSKAKRRKAYKMYRESRYQAKMGNPVRFATVDHIHPISGGGQNAWWNFTAACNICNSTKGSRSLLEFLLDPKPRQKDMRVPLTEGEPVDIGFTMPDTWYDPLGIHADG